MLYEGSPKNENNLEKKVKIIRINKDIDNSIQIAKLLSDSLEHNNKKDTKDDANSN